MKISNSKKELARIISENGGWRDGCDFAVQDKDSWVCFYEGRPTRCGDTWKDKGDCQYRFGFTQDNTLTNWHQSCLSHDEYFHLYPAPDADGWIEWGGGECPVEVGSVVDVKHRDGDIGIRCHAGLGSSEPDSEGNATAEDWSHLNDGGDIIAYRPSKPEQAGTTDKLSSEAVSSAKIALMSDSIEDLVRKPTIEQLAAEYRNLLDFARRKQQEADDAKADADARLKALELAGEAIGLVVSPITDKKEPEMVAAVKVGDEVECVESNIKRDKYNGMVGKLHTIDESDTSTPYLVDLGGEAKIWCHEVKFIRRP